MCGPRFCSMQITQEIRAEALKMGEDAEAARQRGLAEMSERFVAEGSQLYLPEPS
jgi:phosphomethylpyrimidine synthase